jgi:2-polyprenyl-3-methyl-5-hydroxy-6-metoxy-1,4-benzoquinol methylase
MHIRLECTKLLATDSLDYLYPLGTKQDCSRNQAFNEKLYPLIKWTPILDLGCAGGGFVEDCLKDGQRAVGLEGSDFSQKAKRVAWARIPENLFTCDVTEPFQLYWGETDIPIKFGAITAWELLEHIPVEKHRGLFENIRKHLAPAGFFIASTTVGESIQDGHDLHVTRILKPEWIEIFSREGFEYRDDIVQYFNGQFVRGSFEGPREFHMAFGWKRT